MAVTRIPAWYLDIWDGDYGRPRTQPEACEIVAFKRVWSDGVEVEGAVIILRGEFRTAALSELYSTSEEAEKAQDRYSVHAATA